MIKCYRQWECLNYFDKYSLVKRVISIMIKLAIWLHPKNNAVVVAELWGVDSIGRWSNYLKDSKD